MNLKAIVLLWICIILPVIVKAQITTSEVKIEITDNITSVESRLKWGETTNSAWGKGILSMDSGWSSRNYPTIGSFGGNSGSLIMLHNPHIPFRDDCKVEGYNGRSGVRMAVDENATAYWDAGLAGDFYHIYRSGSGKGEFLRITNEGFVGIGQTNPSEKLDILGKLKWGETTNSAWGKGILSMDSGWNSGNYPTIGSKGGNIGSLIMLHNPHIPFRDDCKVEGYDGRSGIRMAVDENATVYWDAGLAGDFYHIYRSGSEKEEFLRVTNEGYVGIGTKTPNYELEVDGAVKASIFYSNTNSWSNFVFEDTYELKSLTDVESFIIKNKHLPNIPNESEVIEKGINLGEMDAKLLQKIEELTLYLIEQNKLNKAQQKKIEQLEKKITSLEKK